MYYKKGMSVDVNSNLDFISTEEDYDRRPLKTNSRKTLAPLFVYQILVNESSKGRHLSQQEIIDILREPPYEIEIERRALGRVLNLLGDENLGIVTSRKWGYWHDERAIYEDWAA